MTDKPHLSIPVVGVHEIVLLGWTGHFTQTARRGKHVHVTPPPGDTHNWSYERQGAKLLVRRSLDATAPTSQTVGVALPHDYKRDITVTCS